MPCSHHLLFLDQKIPDEPLDDWRKDMMRPVGIDHHHPNVSGI